MTEEDKFYKKVKEKLSKICITMPYYSSTENGQNENLFHQFYTCEKPAAINRQVYELFPNFEATKNTRLDMSKINASASPILVHHDGDEIAHFAMCNAGVASFYLPLEGSQRNLSFENVIDALSHDVYDDYLSYTREDDEQTRSEFLDYLDKIDGMEFVKMSQGSPMIASNSSGYVKRLPKDCNYETYAVVFHRLSENDKHKYHSQIERQNNFRARAIKAECKEGRTGSNQ